MNWGEEVETIWKAAKGVEVPIPKRGAGADAVEIPRKSAESRVVAPV